MRLRNARRSNIEIGEFYHRPGELDARVHDEDLRRVNRWSPRRFALLIHGWGVRVEAQAKSYGRLLDQIARLDGDVASSLLTVSWPSKDFYRPALGVAAHAAMALQEKLCDSALPFERARELIIIGHSMGCRVALELAKLLKQNRFRPEIRLFLMAPAVPVPLMGPGAALHEAAVRSERSVVYFSMTDQAFLVPFQVVESWAGPGQGLFPEAVGLRGRPERDVWTERCNMTGYLHGSYWKSDVVAAHIVRDFRRHEVRALPVRPA